MKCKKLFKWELIGVIVIFVLGLIWHNLYKISGNNLFIGMIAPVNESMWEHWKLGLFPILIYAAVEYKFVKDEGNNFLFSKFIGIIIFEIVCFGIIYLWHEFFGEASFKANMVVDIFAYFIGVLAGQLASYNIACNTKKNQLLWYIGAFGIAAHIIIFILFTFNPPKVEYFKDSITGKYGI